MSIVEATPDVLPTDIEPDEYPLDTEAKFTTSMKGATMFEENYCITANYPLNKIKPSKGGVEPILRARVCTFLAGLAYYVL